MLPVSRYLYGSKRSLESLLDDLGHLDVDDEDLIEEHRDDLIPVLIVVPLDFFDLRLNMRILLNQPLIVRISTLLLTLVFLCQFSLVSVDVCLGISVGIGDSLGP